MQLPEKYKQNFDVSSEDLRREVSTINFWLLTSRGRSFVGNVEVVSIFFK